MSKLRNNKGLTLVELLVVIVLASGIMIATTSIFISASKNNARIMQEIKIRDEADYLMSLFVKEFYTLKKSNIVEDMEEDSRIEYVKYKVDYDDKHVGAPNECDPVSTSPRTCTLLSGFIKEGEQVKMYIKGKEIIPMDSSLKITSNSTIVLPLTPDLVNSSSSYKIKLELENTKKTAKNNKISFENEIAIINN